ncbi:hypothetical protein NQZ68_020999 [Xyrichtys novacula]|uniref:Uncharacterized protein n=1 Tax=Xyrichtys novacula TaxID=13765 RepID=A0AAV1FNJ7_XYRNO|nr:hypothetical protein NQZ68_020999 [Xyrichtys novacula]
MRGFLHYLSIQHKLEDLENEHCVTKSLFEQIWTFFNDQPRAITARNWRGASRSLFTKRPKVPQAQFSSSTAVRESGSAVAVVLASRQIASAEGGDTETPAG